MEDHVPTHDSKERERRAERTVLQPLAWRSGGGNVRWRIRHRRISTSTSKYIYNIIYKYIYIYNWPDTCTVVCMYLHVYWRSSNLSTRAQIIFGSGTGVLRSSINISRSDCRTASVQASSQTAEARWTNSNKLVHRRTISKFWCRWFNSWPKVSNSFSRHFKSQPVSRHKQRPEWHRHSKPIWINSSRSTRMWRRALTFEIEVRWKASLSLKSSQEHLEPGTLGTTSSRHGLSHVTRMQFKLSRSWNRQWMWLSQRGLSRMITLMGPSLFQLRLASLWSPWQKVKHWRSPRTPREEPILGWKLRGGCCASMIRRIPKPTLPCWRRSYIPSSALWTSFEKG